MLKKIEKFDPVVYLVTHNYNNVRIEYFTVIELKKTNEIAVWTNFYSSSVHMPVAKSKKDKK